MNRISKMIKILLIKKIAYTVHADHFGFYLKMKLQTYLSAKVFSHKRSRQRNDMIGHVDAEAVFSLEVKLRKLMFEFDL